ncbi:hypothetical protein L083_2879 [Actinoplanes sp. N902-109]|nr:hypothetical protein L083_2879 [Actinoplanes sp. N902-109]
MCDPDRDTASVEQATANLSDELLQSPYWQVGPRPGGAAPPGSRAADVALLGGLLVSLVESPALLELLVAQVRDWLRRDPVPRTVEMSIDGDTIVVSGVSAEDQRRLIESWLARHGGGRG